MTAVMLVALLLSTACAPSVHGPQVSAPVSPTPAADTVLEGTLEVLVEDSSQGSRTLYFLTTADMRVALRFSRSPNLLTGARIRAHGEWAANGDFEVATFEVISR